MKKIKFLGFIAILAVIGIFITSCDEIKYGGSLTIMNNTGGNIKATIINAEYLPYNEAIIENGKSKTWTFKLDGDVTYSWNGTDIINILKGELLEKIKISGGEKKTITAKDQILLVP
jgi:hypothetical protein